jgi:hypothetical protein
MERRESPRVPYGAWVEDLTREGSIQFFLAKDLSLGGLLLTTTETPPEVGHRVHLRLVVEYESRVMAVDGQVIRHAAPENGVTAFAVRFVNLDPPRQTFLEDLLKECMQARAESGEDDEPAPPAGPSPAGSPPGGTPPPTPSDTDDLL